VLVKGRAVAGKSRTMAMAEAAKAARLQKKTFSCPGLKAVVFDKSAVIYGNRGYAITAPDERFTGWALLQTNIRTELGFNVRFTEPTMVVIVCSNRDKDAETVPLAGFEPIGQASLSMTGSPGQMFLFKKTCVGEVAFPPSISYFLLIESKP